MPERGALLHPFLCLSARPTLSYSVTTPQNTDSHAAQSWTPGPGAGRMEAQEAWFLCAGAESGLQLLQGEGLGESEKAA